MSRLTEKNIKSGIYYPLETESTYDECKMNCVRKLGQLEDIEEEMGCPIETLTKAIKNGIWIIPPHSEKRIPIFVRHPYLIFEESINKEGEMENKPLFLFMYRFDEYIHNSGYYFLEDCGKTWALTKEELER